MALTAPQACGNNVPVLTDHTVTELENHMKKLIVAACCLGMLAPIVPACAYAGVGVADGKAVVARNDTFLYGMLRKVFVCEVTDAGLANCVGGESP